MSDEVREGEELAREWLAGRGELIADLGNLVEGMVDGIVDGRLVPIQKSFLRVVGEAARSAAKRKGPAPSRASPPAAQPTAAPPQIDVDASWRRVRERQRAARFEELARRNSRIPIDGGGDFWRARNDDWNGT
jgi:hypothetical protein